MRDTVHRNLSIYRIRDPVLRTYNWVRGLRITDIYSIYLLCLFPRFNSYGFAEYIVAGLAEQGVSAHLKRILQCL